LSHLLKINSLTKTFNRKEILSNISLQIKYGKIIGLEGENGSGKTTLFKIISGIMKPNSGFGQLVNYPIFKSNYEYRKHLVFWSHDPQLYSSLTGYENIKLFLNLRSESEKIKLITLYAEKYGIDSHINKEIRDYSFGQIQRLKLVLLSVSDWNLALLDEPDSGMDENGKLLLKNFILDMKNKNKTFLISSHNKDWLNNFINEKYYLKNTQLIKND